MQMFSVLSWDKTGFIKTWCRMKSVELHDGRGTPLPHVVEGAAPPEYLLGDRRIVAAARERLIDHGIDPDKHHVEGNIAREIILSASQEFFEAGSEAERSERLKKWKAAQVPFLIDRFGEHRVVCAVLHQDEYTPHVHAIILALKHGVDGRCPDKGPHWRLAGDALGRLGSWAQDHTAYANAIAPFGLKRGQENSPNKHRPYGDRMAEIDAEQKALSIGWQKLAEQRKAVEADFADLRDHWERAHQASIQIEKDRREVRSALEAASALALEAETERAEMQAKREKLHQQFALLEHRQQQVSAREAAVSRQECIIGASSSGANGHIFSAQQASRSADI